MPTFAELKRTSDSPALIRKTLEVVAFAAPMTATLPAKLTGANTRTVADGVTTLSSTTLTSATAAFVASDVGKTVAGTGIPTGTTIASVTNATTVVMSAAATAAGTGVSVTITGAGSTLLALPPAWFPIGICDPKGWEHTANTTKDEVDSLGYAQATRSDITRVLKTVKFTAQESFRKNLMQLFYGLDLSTVMKDANGEIGFDHPALPLSSEYRLLVIARDGAPGAEWYVGRGYYRTKVVDIPGSTWTEKGALDVGVTLDVLLDSTAGSAQHDYIAGPGAAAAATALGF